MTAVGQCKSRPQRHLARLSVAQPIALHQKAAVWPIGQMRSGCACVTCTTSLPRQAISLTRLTSQVKKLSDGGVESFELQDHQLRLLSSLLCLISPSAKDENSISTILCVNSTQYGYYIGYLHALEPPFTSDN